MRKLILLVALAFASFGIANAQETADTDPTADLEKGKSAFQETWVHPDADFTKYDKLYLWEAHFEYRDVGPAQRTSSSRMSTRKREFGISDADRQKFEEVVSEAFVKGVQRGKRFALVSDIGPDTMLLRGSALDIISFVPPPTVGMSDVYLSNIGEATLVLELIDAETGEVLAVVAERRKIQSGTGQIDSMSMPTSSVTVIAEVRRWGQRAGSKLASELDKAVSGK